MAKNMKMKRGSFMTGHDEGIGRSDFAGMPKEMRMEEYPRNRMHPGSYLDDTMTDIDAIQTDSVSQMQKHMSYQK